MRTCASAVALVGGAEVPVIRAGRAARLEAAGRGAAVTVGLVPVVALLARLERAVAAAAQAPQDPGLDPGHRLEGAEEERPVDYPEHPRIGIGRSRVDVGDEDRPLGRAIARPELAPGCRLECAEKYPSVPRDTVTTTATSHHGIAGARIAVLDQDRPLGCAVGLPELAAGRGLEGTEEEGSVDAHHGLRERIPRSGVDVFEEDRPLGRPVGLPELETARSIIGTEEERVADIYKDTRTVACRY